MTDPGTKVTRAKDPRAEDPRSKDTGAEQGSRLQQYRKRIEKWAFALRDGAEQHAPPQVLSGLAATANNFARYLDGMAERARVKQAKEEAPVPGPPERVPEPTEQAESASKE